METKQLVDYGSLGEGLSLTGLTISTMKSLIANHKWLELAVWTVAIRNLKDAPFSMREVNKLVVDAYAAGEHPDDKDFAMIAAHYDAIERIYPSKFIFPGIVYLITGRLVGRKDPILYMQDFETLARAKTIEPFTNVTWILDRHYDDRAPDSRRLEIDDWCKYLTRLILMNFEDGDLVEERLVLNALRIAYSPKTAWRRFASRGIEYLAMVCVFDSARLYEPLTAKEFDAVVTRAHGVWRRLSEETIHILENLCRLANTIENFQQQLTKQADALKDTERSPAGMSHICFVE
jgi:hypothetical protein